MSKIRAAGAASSETENWRGDIITIGNSRNEAIFAAIDTAAAKWLMKTASSE